MNTVFRWCGVLTLLLALPVISRAHCDTLDGPVVAAARAAFETGDVSPVLKWVKAADEAEIKSAFDRALRVRRQSPAAAELAETWFFETLVRVHRAGEGAPYTGLKSAGTVEPGIAAADAALADGRRDALFAATVVPVQTALQKKYDRVVALRSHADHSVAAGREYVAAYVDYVHFAERLAALADAGSAEHAEHAEHAH